MPASLFLLKSAEEEKHQARDATRLTLGSVANQSKSVILEVLLQLWYWPVCALVDGFLGSGKVEGLYTSRLLLWMQSIREGQSVYGVRTAVIWTHRNSSSQSSLSLTSCRSGSLLDSRAERALS